MVSKTGLGCRDSLASLSLMPVVRNRFTGTWSTNPDGYREQAKKRAAQYLDVENPPLTALEKAYWKRMRAGLLPT